jgi:hypothetical protein
MALWLPCRPPSSTACRSRRDTSCRDDCHASRIRRGTSASSPHGACHHEEEEEQKCPWTPQVSTPIASPAPHPTRASTGQRRARRQPHRRCNRPTAAPWAFPLRRCPTAPPHLARGRPARPRSGPAAPSRRARSSLPSRLASSNHHAATPQQPSPPPTAPQHHRQPRRRSPEDPEPGRERPAATFLGHAQLR